MDRMKEELARAREYQLALKKEREREEKGMEQVFKRKMLEKFAEDDRVEQMNAQRRRMKELEHKREVKKEVIFRLRGCGMRNWICTRWKESENWRRSR